MKNSKQEIAARAFELTKKYDLENGNCAQCVIAGVFEALEIDDEDAFLTASGFAGGIGVTGDGNCGAVIGGVMALSYLFGRKRDDFQNRAKLMKSLVLSRQLLNKFKEKYGATRCSELQTKFVGRFYDMFKPADAEAAKKTVLEEKCSTLAGETARIVAELIMEQREKDAEKAAKT